MRTTVIWILAWVDHEGLPRVKTFTSRHSASRDSGKLIQQSLTDPKWGVQFHYSISPERVQVA